MTTNCRFDLGEVCVECKCPYSAHRIWKKKIVFISLNNQESIDSKSGCLRCECKQFNFTDSRGLKTPSD